MTDVVVALALVGAVFARNKSGDFAVAFLGAAVFVFAANFLGATFFATSLGTPVGYLFFHLVKQRPTDFFLLVFLPFALAAALFSVCLCQP